MCMAVEQNLPLRLVFGLNLMGYFRGSTSPEQLLSAAKARRTIYPVDGEPHPIIFDIISSSSVVELLPLMQDFASHVSLINA